MGANGTIGFGAAARTATREGAAGWVAPGLAAALVLAVDPWAVQVFVVPKWVVLCTGVPVALAVLGRAGALRWPSRTPWLALLAVVVAATVTGIAPLLSLVGGPYRYLGAATWFLWAGAFVVGSSAPPGVRGRMADVLSLLVAVVALAALLQRAGIDPFGLESSLDRSRAWGTFGSASLLGSFGALTLPVAVGRVRRGARAPVVGVVGAVVCLVAAGSRGGLVGAVVGLLVLAWMRADRRRIALGLVAAVTLATFIVPGTNDRVFGGSDVATATADGRLAQWRLTTELLDARPLLGSGPETYRLRFPSVIDAPFEADHGGDAVQDRAHNLLLDTWVTLGISGVVALTWLISSIGRRGVARLAETGTAGLLAGAVGYLATLGFSFQDAHLDAVVWLVAGVAVSDHEGVATRARRSIAAVAAIAAAAVLGAWAVRDLVVDHRLEAALDAPTADLSEARSAADLAPERVLYRQVAGRIADGLGDHVGALRSFDAALDVAPGDVDLLEDRADALARAALRGTGDLLDAAAAYEGIVDRPAPASGRAWLGYGIVLAELGRLDDAERAWERAAALRPQDPEPVRNLAQLARLRQELNG